MNYGPTPSSAITNPLTRHKHGGNTVDYTPSSAVAAGAVIVLGSLIGIALRDIAANEPGSLAIEGSFDFPKAASDGGMAVGTLAYWDATNQVATGTSSGNNYLGKVELAALTADTVVRIQVESIANGTGSGFGNVPVTTVASAGTNYATGGALSAGFNIVTGADGTKGVSLPSAPAVGTIVWVKGTTSNNLPIYPDAAATINAIGSHGAFTAGTVAPVMLIATSATQWYTFPLVAS